MIDDTGYVDAEIVEREALGVGDTVKGPAIIEQVDTTTVVFPGWQALVSDSGHLVITPF